MTIYKKLGIIGRFKPLHNGGAQLLRYSCMLSEKVLIGIGSINKYNARNPFTYEETRDMIDLYLGKEFDNYKIVGIPDFGHIQVLNEDDKNWVRYVADLFGDVDAVVTGNPYVESLLEGHYKIIKPNDIIPKEEQIMLKATQIRVAMCRGDDWTEKVPGCVAEYIKLNGFDERLNKEFGKEVLENGCMEYIAETIENERDEIRR